MSCRLMVTGAGGFIGSFLVPRLKKDGFDVVRARYSGGELIFSSPLQRNEPIIVLNLAAATSGSNNFSIAYELSIVMVEKLFIHFQSLNIKILKFIQFSSFGELHTSKKGFNILFHSTFKDSYHAFDNYQYWKIKQKDAVAFYFKNISYLVIPFVSNESQYEKIRQSSKFEGLRWGKQILVTRLIDIHTAVRKIISHEAHNGIHFPDLKRIMIKGDFSFIKRFFFLFCSWLVKRDKRKLNKLMYQFSSQLLQRDTQDR